MVSACEIVCVLIFLAVPKFMSLDGELRGFLVVDSIPGREGGGVAAYIIEAKSTRKK